MERVNRLLTNAEFRRCIDAIDAHEVDRAFCKHGLNHLLDTARIAYILVLENGLNISKGMVYATALLHDIGRYDEYYHGIPHDQAHDRAKKILVECDYSPDEIRDILGAISQHRRPHERLETLGDVLSKADKLSRNCFDCHAIRECYWLDSKKNHRINY